MKRSTVDGTMAFSFLKLFECKVCKEGRSVTVRQQPLYVREGGWTGTVYEYITHPVAACRLVNVCEMYITRRVSISRLSQHMFHHIYIYYSFE